MFYAKNNNLIKFYDMSLKYDSHINLIQKLFLYSAKNLAIICFFLLKSNIQ